MAGGSDLQWAGYKNYDHYYWVNPQNLNLWFNEAVESGFPVVGVKKRYYDVPASFDIETSSFVHFGKKYATMYLWSFCLNGSTLLGRTWDEWRKTLSYIEARLNTKKITLIIYVHNLGYEFQFMRNWFEWDEVFAVKERRPVHASLPEGIEFKCSYLLSNYALSYIGAKLLHKYPVEKAVGDLDYSKIRHSKTGLTHEEIWYSVKDVQVVTSYIEEKIEEEGGINNIPLTNTGYVRRYCREFCFTQFEQDIKKAKKNSALYHDRMKSLSITSACEYDQLHQAFAGGFTHAGVMHSGKIRYNVGSADLASSYPAVMVMKKFPMSKGTFIGNRSEFEVEQLIQKGYCVLFTVRLYDVTPKFIYENYLSYSRCTDISENAVVNNGRVSSADYLQVTVTEQDWDLIKKCYDFDKSKTEFYSVRYYYADYLPKPFILSILNLFGKKTSLKGVEGRETEYMVSKNMINSAYGMSVTNIIRDIYEYSNDIGWNSEDADVSTQLVSYNTNHNRFLFYAWGVWVTAHARHNLWEAILEFGQDYIYSDTDSIKGLNFDKHKSFFILYNNRIECEISRMCKFMGINPKLCHPKTVKGKTKTIGVFEIEESYKTFKTIGAKRYIYEYESGELLFTVSGVNKHYGVPYLLRKYSHIPEGIDLDLAYSANPNLEKESKAELQKVIEAHNSGEIDYKQVLEKFNEGLYFPPDATGKQTLTYVDNSCCFPVTDYRGLTHTVFEYSYIHMEPQSYYMSQTEEYKKLLLGYKDASL